MPVVSLASLSTSFHSKESAASGLKELKSLFRVCSRHFPDRDASVTQERSFAHLRKGLELREHREREILVFLVLQAHLHLLAVAGR